MATSYPQQAPTIQERLRRAVVNHQATEEPSIEMYRKAAESASDPMVRMVLGEILQDEERHHEEMSKLAVRLTNPAAPGKGAPSPDDPTADEIKELIEHEHTGTERLHALADEYGAVDAGLPSLLLHAMADDSARHEKMLRYVLGRLEG